MSELLLKDIEIKDEQYDIKIKSRKMKIISCSYKVWEYFKAYHYQTNINNASRCYAIVWKGIVVGFHSSLILPQKRHDGRTAWRGHRTVIFPKYQKLGIATNVTNFIASMFVKNGNAYYTKTTNIILGAYRNKHTEIWRATKHNGKIRNLKDLKENIISRNAIISRASYCHEYVGNAAE